MPEPTPPADGTLDSLVTLIRRLRSDNGCPWDRKQTPETLRTYLIEETYELVDAIDRKTAEAICEEIGDVLFQLVFLARLFEEQGLFDLTDVIRNNTRKMIHRHPHVFGETPLTSTEAVRRQWKELKKAEKSGATDTSVLDSVPAKLPALMRAYRISERAVRAGFDWDDLLGVMEKVEEEWAEFKTALAAGGAGGGGKQATRLEFGDILFTLVNVARFLSIHPETALSEATRKFEGRFRRMEQKAAGSGQSIDQVSRDEMERLWNAVKAEEY